MTRTTISRILALVSILSWLSIHIFMKYYLIVSTSLFESFIRGWFIVSFLIGVVTIVYILFSGEIRKLRGVILMLVYILVCCGMFTPTVLEIKEVYDARYIDVKVGKDKIMVIGDALLSYERDKDQFPSSQHWCDSIFKQEGDSRRALQYWTEVDDVVFNIHLSELPIDDLDPNTVLIYEAEGTWNCAGGSELFPGTRWRDEYFPRKEKFAFVFFLDGTLAKYRLHDDAVALYIPVEDSFSDWHQKGETPYSPLKWE